VVHKFKSTSASSLFLLKHDHIAASILAFIANLAGCRVVLGRKVVILRCVLSCLLLKRVEIAGLGLTRSQLCLKILNRLLVAGPRGARLARGLLLQLSILLLFVDALQRMFRVTAESDLGKTHGQPMQDVRTETKFAARKFYAQRNVYLTGFTLFLSLVLTRCFYIILDLIHVQEEYAKLKQETAGKSRASGASDQKMIEDLKAKLTASEAKARDFETLKKQAAQNASEYDNLATKYNSATGQVSDKRKD